MVLSPTGKSRLVIVLQPLKAFSPIEVMFFRILRYSDLYSSEKHYQQWPSLCLKILRSSNTAVLHKSLRQLFSDLPETPDVMDNSCHFEKTSSGIIPTSGDIPIKSFTMESSSESSVIFHSGRQPHRFQWTMRLQGLK